MHEVWGSYLTRLSNKISARQSGWQTGSLTGTQMHTFAYVPADGQMKLSARLLEICRHQFIQPHSHSEPAASTWRHKSRGMCTNSAALRNQGSGNTMAGFIQGIPAFQWRPLCLSLHCPVMKTTHAGTKLIGLSLCVFVTVRVKYKNTQAEGWVWNCDRSNTIRHFCCFLCNFALKTLIQLFFLLLFTSITHSVCFHHSSQRTSLCVWVAVGLCSSPVIMMPNGELISFAASCFWCLEGSVWLRSRTWTLRGNDCASLLVFPANVWENIKLITCGIAVLNVGSELEQVSAILRTDIPSVSILLVNSLKRSCVRMLHLNV